LHELKSSAYLVKVENFKLFIANKNYSSWSLRAWLALKEAEIKFSEEVILLGKANTLFQIQSRSPSGKIPLLEHSGVQIWDSLAIAEYVHDLKGNDSHIWPANMKDRAGARSLVSEMHAGFQNLRREAPMNIRLRKELSDLSPDCLFEIKRIFQIWREQLKKSGGPYLFGDWSFADATFCPVHLRFQSYAILYPPELLEYKNLILKRPSLNEWVASALLETERIDKYEIF